MRDTEEWIVTRFGDVGYSRSEQLQHKVSTAPEILHLFDARLSARITTLSNSVISPQRRLQAMPAPLAECELEGSAPASFKLRHHAEIVHRAPFDAVRVFSLTEPSSPLYLASSPTTQRYSAAWSDPVVLQSVRLV